MRPRLLLHVASLQARTRMSYRADFWILIILGVAAEFALAWFLWTALFAESGRETIGGYTRDGMILYSVVAILLSKFTRSTQFQEPMSQDIYTGGLSRYLVYPTSYFSFKYAQQLGTLAPALLQIGLFGALFAALLDAPPEASPTLAGVLMAAPAILLANFLYYLMQFPLQAVAFWADNVWSLMVCQQLVAGLLGGYLMPLSLFPGWAQDVLLWLPFRNLFALPVETLLGRVGVLDWLLGLGVGLAWCGILAWIGHGVWNRGRRVYTGVGM